MYGVVNLPSFDDTKIKVGSVISFDHIRIHKFIKTHGGLQAGNIAIITKVEAHKLTFTCPNYHAGGTLTADIHINEVLDGSVLFSVVDVTKLNFIVD